MTTPSDADNTEERWSQRQKMVLVLLFDDRFPWAMEEIRRELGDDAVDAVGELEGAGLVYRFGDGERKFVIPTRAARRADVLYLGAL